MSAAGGTLEGRPGVVTGASQGIGRALAEGLAAAGARVALLPYNVSKAGLIALTKSVAVELAAQGITCNAIAPGVIETPLTREYFTDPELAPSIRANTPLGRWGQPQDLVAPVVFLCGPGADFVQGETLVVDGGWVAGKGY